MKYIAHRGLIDGYNIKKENHPDTLNNAWKLQYQCEVDVWYVNNNFVLGHDSPQYVVSAQYIIDNAHHSWYHCKNFEALSFFDQQPLIVLNYFWHENDKFTLTSMGHIWTYPKNPIGPSSICVLPELFMSIEDCVKLECSGICSDYIGVIRAMRMKV